MRVEVDGASLHGGVTGAGPDVLVLSGGPGCVHYLEQDKIAPVGHRAWYPEPRGVGRSGGGGGPEVHAALGASFTEWIRGDSLWRGLADCEVPMAFVAAGDDIRPSWPMAQLARTVRPGTFATVPDVPHDFWSTHPQCGPGRSVSCVRR
ncbi:hypothetical protein NPS01_33940 [Nocardioides psychrotolerans]|nr:hypothetical protein NPS01_33940 [Nocardioides psychrotolerans]